MGKAMVCPKTVKNQRKDMMIVIDVISRPYLHMYAHSNELEELGIISLSGVNVQNDPLKESLLGVSVEKFLLAGASSDFFPRCV